MKIALLLGANIFFGSYAGCHQQGQLWKAEVQSSENISDEDLFFNVLIGADGITVLEPTSFFFHTCDASFRFRSQLAPLERFWL